MVGISGWGVICLGYDWEWFCWFGWVVGAAGCGCGVGYFGSWVAAVFSGFGVMNLFVGGSCVVVVGFGTLARLLWVADLVVLVYICVWGFDCVAMWVVCISLVIWSFECDLCLGFECLRGYRFVIWLLVCVLQLIICCFPVAIT